MSSWGERGARAISSVRVLGAVVIALSALLALPPAPALADDPRGGQGAPAPGNVFLAGPSVDFADAVDGNLVVTGGTVNVAGTVGRDLVVTGGTVTVPGDVRGSIRALGGSVTLMGPVGGDVIAAGGSLELGLGATVGSDVVLRGDTAVVAGVIGRRLLATVHTLTLRGRVVGNVEADVGRLRLEDGSTVGGDVAYVSDRPASIAPGASVAGRVSRTGAQGQVAPASRLLGGLVTWLLGLAGLFLLGLALPVALPRVAGRLLAGADRARRAGARWRVAMLAAMPAVLPLAFIGMVVLGVWWLAVLAGACLAVVLAAGYLLAGLLMGRYVVSELGWRRAPAEHGARRAGAALATHR